MANVDSGTGLGAGTRVLTGVLTVFFLPFVWTARGVRAVTHPSDAVKVTVARCCRVLYIGACVLVLLGLAFVGLGAEIAALQSGTAGGSIGVSLFGLAPLLIAFFLADGLLAHRLRRQLARGASAIFAAVVEPSAGALGRARRRAAHSFNVASSKAASAAAGRSLPAPSIVSPAPHPTAPPAFETVAYQNEYLPAEAMLVNAIITVTAPEEAMPRTELAEVFLIDCSGSMAYPMTKLRAARRAVAAGIDALPDGAWFGIVRGTEVAEQIFPPGGGLAQASAETRDAAKKSLRRLWAEGGTVIGAWLGLAAELFGSVPGVVGHAVLLTDGRDEGESVSVLEGVLEGCVGRFQCDCRGVGTDWEVSELRRVASRLLGSVDIVAEPSGLEADFRLMVEGAMGRGVGEVLVRVWVPVGARLVFVKQVAPVVEELAVWSVEGQVVSFLVGAWGVESRDYHVCVEVPARSVGEEMLAGRWQVVVAGEVVAQALLRAVWTDDEVLSTRISREVAHYTGQAELAGVIQEGLEARRRGELGVATERLGRAVRLASASGHEATLRLLEQVVEVEDAGSGTVRLRERVDQADEMALDTRSTRSVRLER
jgi:hypothetical protein